MAFERIHPHAGARATAGLTVSWNTPRKYSGPRLTVTIGAELCSILEIARNTKLDVEHERILGVLRITPAEPGWGCRYNGTYAKLIIPLDNVDLRESRPARAVPFVVVSGKGTKPSLKLTLPDWAAPERVAIMRREGIISMGAR